MGAAANRIKNLAEALHQKNNSVTVFCPLPNYPKGEIFSKYKGKFSVTETINDIIVKRFWLYPSNSKNNFVRIFSMLSFAISIWTSLIYILKKKPDLFIIQSPPLFVALSGILLSKITKTKNILNVSDLWPLSALELGVIRKGFFYNFLLKIEKFNYKKSDKIMVQSSEIKEYVFKISKKDSIVYRNVPNYKVYTEKNKNKGELKIVYAGLLGFAQGILNICKQINFKELKIEFHIFGDGMEKEAINSFVKSFKSNIFFHGSLSASEVKDKIRTYDVALVPLKNRISGAVPSKIFELMQLGVPLIYNSYGEAKDIILKNNIGFVSEQEDFKSLKKTLLKFKNLEANKYLEMSENCLKQHSSKYKLEYQIEKAITYINEKT